MSVKLVFTLHTQLYDVLQELRREAGIEEEDAEEEEAVAHSPAKNNGNGIMPYCRGTRPFTYYYYKSTNPSLYVLPSTPPRHTQTQLRRCGLAWMARLYEYICTARYK